MRRGREQPGSTDNLRQSHKLVLLEPQHRRRVVGRVFTGTGKDLFLGFLMALVLLCRSVSACSRSPWRLPRSGRDLLRHLLVLGHIEDVEPSAWTATVYEPDIAAKAGTIFKTPGYAPA
ncbi:MULTISPECIES: hypothetical protein [Methylobacterium]|uniref:hypothetical protein n=1 Tax=Methylobacterium TaxID=407 RepID=UPI0013ED25A1|nr:hypothetical protein [Methylobacterium sp. DB0501]NGM33064.1 hypothetical protein [Methylobacterium sp. DB0501]